MTWINAEVLVRAIQQQEERQAYQRELQRQQEIRRTLRLIQQEVGREDESAQVLQRN